MTLAELKKNQSDIILNPLTWDELRHMANGAALFYASLSRGTKPKDSRKILWAGQVMTVGMASDQLMIVRSTVHGNVKADAIAKSDLEPDGRAALFETTPIPEYDMRNMEPWNHWD